jgi:hypothetical protein
MDHQALAELTYKEVKEIRRDITKIKVEIATLKVKSGLWGLVSGAIPVIMFIVLKNLA